MGLEADLEDWIEANPSLLAEGLTVVARQVQVDAGYLDLLCIDVQGRWVVVELKRERLYREAVAQALDYAACVSDLADAELKEVLEAAWRRRQPPDGAADVADSQLADELSGRRDIRVVVAGAGTDPGLERVVDFLGRYDVPVSVVTFQVFEPPDGELLLIREVIDDERTPRTSAKATERSLDAVRERAVSAGVADAFDQVVSAATSAGLALRPYSKSVMIAPPTQRNRFLIVLEPEPGRGLGVNFGPEAFAEFFTGMAADDVEDALGPAGMTWHSGDAASAIAERLADFLAELPDLLEPSDARADAPTVMRLARQIHAGEWTTYGEISMGAIGRRSAAMSVGTMASRMPDFPNAHRVLNRRGEVPDAWSDGLGSGPEECRRRLELEGVRFGPDGRADPAQRISGQVMQQRASVAGIALD